MFEPTKKFFKTQGVNHSLSDEIVTKLLDSIMELKQEISEVDYLQVFDFTVDGSTTHIKHSQEVPPHEKEIILSDSSNSFEGKIFIIDDEEYVTVLLSEEY